MVIVDAQVHIWEHDHPGRPWRPGFELVLDQFGQKPETASRRPELTGADMLIEMADAGVNAAIIVSSSLQYGFDSSHAFETAAAFPDKFGVVGCLNPDLPDIDEQVKAWRERPNGLGLRIVAVTSAEQDRLALGGYDYLLAGAQRHSVPMCLYAPGRWDLIEVVAMRYPNLQIVIDHLGLSIVPPRVPFQRLESLLRLSTFGNIAVKLSALPAHSKEPFPFLDLRPILEQVIDAFGVSRLMWGSDWTRINGVTYRQGVRYIQDSDALSASEKEALLGGSLLRVFRWHKPGTGH